MGKQQRTRDGFYKRGAVWWTLDPVTGRRSSTGCRDLGAARLWRTERERLAASPADAAAQTSPVGLWLSKLVDLKRREGGDQRAAYYLKALGPWVRIIGNAIVTAKVTPELLDRYVAARRSEGVTDHTITKEWACLRQALALAKRGGAFPGDIASLRPPDLHQSYTPRKRTLSTKEFAQLMDVLRWDRAAFVVLAVTLGLRKGEIEGLEPGDWFPNRGLVHVRGTKTEGADRWVSVFPQWRELTETALGCLPLGVWHMAVRDLAVACRAAKVKPTVTPNDLRRTYATLLVEGGVGLDTVRRLMGHTTTTMVERVYGRPKPEAVGALAAAGALPTLSPDSDGLVQNRHSGAGPIAETAPPTRFERVTFRLGSPSRHPEKSQKPAILAAVDGRGRADTAGDGWAPAQNRHSAPVWSLAYAYRDVLSRRAVA